MLAVGIFSLFPSVKRCRSEGALLLQGLFKGLRNPSFQQILTMRKASIFLSQLSRHRIKSFAPLLFRDYVSNPSFSSSPLFSPTHLKPCAKTHGLLLKSNQFRRNQIRNMDTLTRVLVEKQDQLAQAFCSAGTAEEMLRIFKEMESCLDEQKLAKFSVILGLKLSHEGEDPEKVIPYANRALKTFEKDDPPYSEFLVLAFLCLGTTNFKLRRFAESLGYLQKAIRISDWFEANDLSGRDSCGLVYPVLNVLANLKMVIGLKKEGLEHLGKLVEIKEKIFGKDSREVGVESRGLAQSYVSELYFKEALPYCLKALEIHKKQLERNSVDVAYARRLLGVIYTGLEEHEKALEQNELSRKVFSNWGQSSDLIDLEMFSANVHIVLGKYETAINTLRGVVEMTDEDSLTRASVFISMGKALHFQEKIEDSKRCLEIACGILDKKETASPVEEVVDAYVKIVMQYESMEEFETAISLLKRPLAFLQKLPQEQPSKGKVNAMIGWLLLSMDKLAEAIPHLELAASILKETYGTKNFILGYIYNNLGAAYLVLDSRHRCISYPSAAETFAVAKDIMDESLGPHRRESIMVCQNLSTAYDFMGRYDCFSWSLICFPRWYLIKLLVIGIELYFLICSLIWLLLGNSAI
jgi:tetratricopeptide (TPR) repeat protein